MLDFDNLPPELQAQISSMISDYEDSHPKCRACGEERAEEGSEYCVSCNAEIRAFKTKFPELFTGAASAAEKNSPDGPFDCRPECVCVPVERYYPGTDLTASVMSSEGDMGHYGNDIYYLHRSDIHSDGEILVYPGNGAPYRFDTSGYDTDSGLYIKGISVNSKGVFVHTSGSLILFGHDGTFKGKMKLPGGSISDVKLYIYDDRIFVLYVVDKDDEYNIRIESACFTDGDGDWSLVADLDKIMDHMDDNLPSFVSDEMEDVERECASSGAKPTFELQVTVGERPIRAFFGDAKYLVVRVGFYYTIEAGDECYNDGILLADLLIDIGSGEIYYLSCDKGASSVLGYDLENNAMYLCSDDNVFSKIPIGRPEKGLMGTEALKAGKVSETVLGKLPACFSKDRNVLIYSDTQIYCSPSYNCFYSIYAVPGLEEYASDEWNRSGHGKCGSPICLGEYIYEELDEFYCNNFETLLPAVGEYPEEGRRVLEEF